MPPIIPDECSKCHATNTVFHTIGCPLTVCPMKTVDSAFKSDAIDRKDQALIKKLRRQVNRVRNFPANTCPASRHLHIMADSLSGKYRAYPMLQEEPLHCAISIYSTLLSLWEARTHLQKLKSRSKVLKVPALGKPVLLSGKSGDSR